MQRLVTVVGLYLTQPDLICPHILMNIIKWVLYAQLCSLINPLTTDAGKGIIVRFWLHVISWYNPF